VDNGFRWVPFFEELAKALLSYRNQQAALVAILQAAGVTKGLQDENPAGTKIPLSKIDPFTFFAQIVKSQNFEKRSAKTGSIKEQLKLSAENPSDFKGMPSCDPRSSWLFAYEYERGPTDIDTLWDLFEELMTGSVSDSTFEKALGIKMVGKAKLTQAMFWAAPRKVFPVDSQTRPFLEANGLATDFNSATDYLAICEAVEKKCGKPLYALSHEAFELNKKPNATVPNSLQAQQNTAQYGDKPPLEAQPLNQILYGPPGTGKTYTTKQKAVEICLGAAPEDRAALSAEYEKLRQQNRIEFVTFHQSFSYEDFVEGLRPVIDDEGDKPDALYECRPGVFKRICTAAEAALTTKVSSKDGIQLGDKRLFKMSLGDTKRPDEAYIYPECIENGYILLGYGKGLDFSGCKTAAQIATKLKPSIPDIKPNDYDITSVYYLISEIKVGDLVLVSDGNLKYRAIGQVSGEYEYLDRAGKDTYCQKRAVKWLRVYEESQPINLIFAKRLSQMTVYLMDQSSINRPALEAILAPQKTNTKPDNYVLVIDEINRANISKVLGELISLLEPDKRIGENEQLKVRLPYSQKDFGVPKNLYVIGTMNTADRSIALLDTALRRRFDFTEMEPDYRVFEKPGGSSVQDETGKAIDLRYVLMAINDRLEFLLGRDQRVGHAYLTGVTTIEELNRRFVQQVIPLLKEYFYEDWGGVAKVLAVTKDVTPFVSKTSVDATMLFGSGIDEAGYADTQERYVAERKLTGDMYRGLYAGREQKFTERLAAD
jgi:5-methylcytosine-specific restriction protein B